MGLAFSTPVASGRRPISRHAKTSLPTSSHHAELAPEPLSIDPWALHLRCLRHLPPRSCVGGGCCCCNAAAGAAAILESLLLMWLLIARHGQPINLHAAALRRGRGRLHVGGSHHIVMSPSEALPRPLKSHDHCFNWMVVLLLRASCGANRQMVTWETTDAMVYPWLVQTNME